MWTYIIYTKTQCNILSKWETWLPLNNPGIFDDACMPWMTINAGDISRLHSLQEHAWHLVARNCSRFRQVNMEDGTCRRGVGGQQNSLALWCRRISCAAKLTNKHCNYCCNLIFRYPTSGSPWLLCDYPTATGDNPTYPPTVKWPQKKRE